MATSSRIPAAGSAQLQATGSRTQTQTQTPTTQPVLHLRGVVRRPSEEQTDDNTALGSTRRIQWADDVVDNEGLGRKKSKVCCIYHAPRGIDESSDESSSGSDDSDSDNDDGGARPSGGRGKGKKDDDDGCGHDHGKGKGHAKKRSPNAYEKQPKVKGGDTAAKG